MYKCLKKEMKEKGITIKEIAECLGVHRNSVYNKLNSNKKFYVDEAIKIHSKYFEDLEFKNLFEK